VELLLQPVLSATPGVHENLPVPCFSRRCPHRSSARDVKLGKPTERSIFTIQEPFSLLNADLFQIEVSVAASVLGRPTLVDVSERSSGADREQLLVGI
jgi:hypothetical protein